MKKQKEHRVAIIMLIILYLVTVVINAIILSRKLTFSLGTIQFTTTVVNGMVTSFNCLLTTIIMILNAKIGYRIVACLFSLQILFMLIPVIMKRDTGAMTGLCVAVSYFISLTVINYYTHQLDKRTDELGDLVYNDMITSLPNRRAFMEQANKMIDEQREFSLVYVDVDDFKSINDVRGHNVGDRVLRELGERWKSLLPKSVYMARLGGDEYALIVPKHCSKEKAFLKIRAQQGYFSQQILIEGNEFNVTSSIGVACYPEDALDGNRLLGCADTALYQAKHEGRFHISLYNEKLKIKLTDHVTMENKIRAAIKNNGLYMVYQPQYSAKDKKLRGYEALVRMHDEYGETIMPGQFIPVAEKSELIMEIEQKVIPLILSDMKKIWDTSDEKPMVSINISAKHLFARDFALELKKYIIKADVPCELIEIEVTETVGIQSLEQAEHILDELRHFGLSIALDDFGTGFASMSYLSQLPFELLKIDKSFIDSLEMNGRGKNFVQTIVSIGHVLDIPVLAEGVETEEQLQLLQEMECDYIQGYIWGRPEIIDQIK